MATHAGLASSKVIILVLGAGVTGHVILGKARLSDLIGNIQEILSKGVNEKGETISPSTDSAALQAQIWKLTQEVKQLYHGRQITVVTANDSRNGTLSSYVLPIVVVGAAGYCYMWWKGWSFSDFMYVTKRNMANAVSTFTKQMEQVSAALAATKRHLTQRMEQLNNRMTEQKEVTSAIKHEVGQVREDIAQMGFDIENVQRLVEGLGMRIESIEDKQDLTNAGVIYLCRFVRGLAGGDNPELLQFFQDKPRGLERLPSSIEGATGLKGLQSLAETLQSGIINSEDQKTPNNGGPPNKNISPGLTLHRGLKCF